MKMFIIALLTTTVAVSASTLRSIKESEAKINIATIKDSIVLEKDEESDIEVRIVTSYLGQSTDVSPRYQVFIIFYHGGEMNNTKTAFNLGRYWEFLSAKRKGRGLYEINVAKIGTTLETITLVVDMKQVFIDDANLDIEDFEDPYFDSQVTII